MTRPKRLFTYAPPVTRMYKRLPLPAGLSRKLDALGNRHRIVYAGNKLALCVAISVGVLALQMFADWLVELRFIPRLCLLVTDVLILSFYFRTRVMSVLFSPLHHELCAFLVEKAWPHFRGSLIAAVQLSGPRAPDHSEQLVSSLLKRTDEETAKLDFGQIIPLRPFLRCLARTLLVIGIGSGLFYATWPGSMALLKRVFLLPAKVPRQTEVVCLTGNKIIPAGDNIVLDAQARGVVPSHGRATLRYDSGKIQEITMDPDREQPDRFRLTVASLSEPMSYTIRLNDGVSDSYRVETVPRPSLTSMECEQIYPSYTGAAPVKRTVGNLALLAGSRLKIHAVANGKMKRAMIKLVGKNKEIPMTIEGGEGCNIAGEFEIPPTGLTGFSIRLVNQAGVSTGDETVYRIDTIPDRAPSIQLTFPERLQEMDTIKAKPTIAFAADDDYGLDKIFLCYRVIQEESIGDPQKIEMDMGSAHPQNIRRRYELNMTSIKPALKEGVTLEYWMEARDGNVATGPGITESDHHTIKIISELEKKAEVMDRLMDSLNTINNISTKQEKVNRDLGDVIHGKKEAP